MLTFHILLQQRVKAVLVILEDNSDRGLWSFAELSPEESEDVLFKEVQNYKPFIAFSHGLFPSSDPSFMIPFCIEFCSIFSIYWRYFSSAPSWPFSILNAMNPLELLAGLAHVFLEKSTIPWHRSGHCERAS